MERSGGNNGPPWPRRPATIAAARSGLRNDGIIAGRRGESLAGSVRSATGQTAVELEWGVVERPGAGTGRQRRSPPAAVVRATDLLPLCPMMRAMTQKRSQPRAPAEQGRTVSVQPLGRERYGSEAGWSLPASAFREAMWF